MVLMCNLFSNFWSFVCFFGAILYYVTCVCASPWFDQSQPRDVESAELFEFGEKKKVGVVFEADFIADLAIVAFFGLNASLRLDVVPVKSS